MNQYSFSFMEYFSSSFSKRIAIILVLVFVMKIAVVQAAVSCSVVS